MLVFSSVLSLLINADQFENFLNEALNLHKHYDRNGSTCKVSYSGVIKLFVFLVEMCLAYSCNNISFCLQLYLTFYVFALSLFCTVVENLLLEQKTSLKYKKLAKEFEGN